jgi:hypothetical protein
LRRGGLLGLARVAGPPEPLQVTDRPGTQPNLGFPPGAFAQAGFLSPEPEELSGTSWSRSTTERKAGPTDIIPWTDALNIL